MNANELADEKENWEYVRELNDEKILELASYYHIESIYDGCIIEFAKAIQNAIK